jgi:hypothetical protein
MTRARDLASTALNSTVNTTELGYLDGVTSSVQTQLDAKAPSSTAVTLTGTQTLTNKTLTSPALTTPTISTVDAKGDLLVGTADNTVDRLAAGNSGEQLVADSSTSTGLRYQAPVQQNPILNSSFQVWQRGTSGAYSASGTPYGADRFTIYSGNTGTNSRQVTGDTTNLPNIQYAARTQRTAAVTNTAAFYFGQSFENINSIPFVGKTVTFSYYARKGANFSGSNLTTLFIQSTGTDQNYITGAITGGTTLLASNIASTITTSWQRFSHTFSVTTAATQIGFYYFWAPDGTAGANDWFEVTGIQLEVGSVATPFRTFSATIQGELAACQRYYWRNTATGDAFTPFNYGVATSTERSDHYFQFPVTMRTRPTSAGGSNLTLGDLIGGNFPITSLTLNTNNAQGAFLYSGGATGLTQFRAMALFANNNTSAYVEFSAEL